MWVPVLPRTIYTQYKLFHVFLPTIRTNTIENAHGLHNQGKRIRCTRCRDRRLIMLVWKRKRRLLKTFDLMPVGSVSERCKKGRVKLRERQYWSQFFEMFLFLHENISQSVKGVFKRSAIVPAMKSNRCTKDLVNNVNLLLTRLLFPRLITPPIQWLERNASRQAIKHSASNLKLRITKTSRLKAFEVI